MGLDVILLYLKCIKPVLLLCQNYMIMLSLLLLLYGHNNGYTFILGEVIDLLRSMGMEPPQDK